VRGKGQITEFERGHLLSSRWSTFSDGKLRVRCLNREAYGGGAIEVGAGIGMASRRSCLLSMRTGGSHGLGFFSVDIAGDDAYEGEDSEVNLARDFVTRRIGWDARQRRQPCAHYDKTGAPEGGSNHHRLSITASRLEAMFSSLLPSGSSKITASGGSLSPVYFDRISSKRRR